ncbi:hypothetical protein [Nocardia asteroides]|uniref:hypothetical protein n=1 Tax=Nocardia asteroides TaxID=1824 RepID=UPI00365400C5
MAKQNFVLMSADAGLSPIEAENRAHLLSGIDLSSTLRVVAELWSKLDDAMTNGQKYVPFQVALLRSTGAPWAEALVPRVRKGDFLVPPRALTQLTREILEYAAIDAEAGPATSKVLTHLILSINTEQNRSIYSDDGLASPESIQQMSEDAVTRDSEQTLAALRELMLSEVSNAIADSIRLLEVLQANTQELWFRPWPEKVTHPGLGGTPAETFASANGVELIDLLALGQIIAKRAKAGQVEFTRAYLLAAGATERAVSFCIEDMSLPPTEYRAKLIADQRHGRTPWQRYTMTQYPFLQLSADTVLLLRYQWGIDRFFGSLLYWPTFMALPSHKRRQPVSGSAAEAFSEGMNHAFERSVGDSLSGLVSGSRKMKRLVHEAELQAAWTEKKGALASACDWVIPAGQHCFVIDATNHHLDAALVQGMGSVEDYAADIVRTFSGDDGKFNQVAKSIRKLYTNGSEFGVSRSAVFVPLIVVPDGGVPNLDTTDLDLQLRSRPHLEEFDGRILAPAVLTLPDLQFLEGITQSPLFPLDVADIIVQWRRACMVRRWPIRLHEFLDGLPARPVPRRMISAYKELARTLDASVGPSSPT